MALKIGGIEVNGPSQEVLVLPRLDGQDIIIRASAVLDMGPFDSMCPLPKAPARLVAGGFEKDVQNPNYVEQLQEHGNRRFAYICLKSLEPSEIEWEKVDIGNPATWTLWTQELAEAGLSSVEINRITLCVMQANSLDENKLQQARETFLRGQGNREPKSSGQDTELQNTPSGEPVNDSE